MNLPNALTWLRLIFTPFLFITAFAGERVVFAFLFALGGFTDVLDGFLARRMKRSKKQVRYGNTLDTVADTVFYPSGLLVALFEPSIFDYGFEIGGALGFWFVAMMVCVYRGTYAAHHPVTSKVAALSGFLGVLYLAFFGLEVWWVHVFSVLCVIAGINRLRLKV